MITGDVYLETKMTITNILLFLMRTDLCLLSNIE